VHWRQGFLTLAFCLVSILPCSAAQEWNEVVEAEVDVDRRRLDMLGLGENTLSIAEIGELDGRMNSSAGSGDDSEEAASCPVSELESSLVIVISEWLWRKGIVSMELMA
jgi:hypothetical protein